MTIIINPGSGPVGDAAPDQALANIVAFASDVADAHNIPMPAIRRDSERDRDGRYGFVLTHHDDSEVTVDMPGCPLTMPRLYVNGSSWWWPWAIRQAGLPDWCWRRAEVGPRVPVRFEQRDSEWRNADPIPAAPDGYWLVLWCANGVPMFRVPVRHAMQPGDVVNLAIGQVGLCRMTDVPLWLLDVDGVLNAVREDVPDDYRSTDVQAGGARWPIIYRPKVIEFIRDLHTSGRVEVRWLTTWCHDAANNLSPALGLPLGCAVEGVEDHRSRGLLWWKATAARRIIESTDRPVVWADDDLRYALASGELAWLPPQRPVLLISPDFRQGLSDDDLRDIEAFVRDPASAVGSRP